jgi:hypothetical protein
MGRLKSKRRKKTCTRRVLTLTRDWSCVMAAPNETTATSLTPNKSLVSHVAPCHAHGDSRSPAHRPLPSTGRRHHDRRQLQHEGRQSPAVGNSGVFPGEPHAYRPRKVVQRKPEHGPRIHRHTDITLVIMTGTTEWVAANVALLPGHGHLISNLVPNRHARATVSSHRSGVPQDPRVHASLARGKKLCWTCDTNQVVDACPAGLEN